MVAASARYGHRRDRLDLGVDPIMEARKKGNECGKPIDGPPSGSKYGLSVQPTARRRSALAAAGRRLSPSAAPQLAGIQARRHGDRRAAALGIAAAV